MKFKINLIIYLLLSTSINFLYSNQTNASEFISYSDKNVNLSNADSIIYLRDKWGSTTITTLEQFNEKDTSRYPKPFSPSTPIGINISEISQIKMDIRDSNNTLMKSYKFDISEPGNYSIQWWAFYQDLPAGKYTYEFDISGEIKKYLIIKSP